jgi:ABC-type amino acid transport substrate-binding protein
VNRVAPLILILFLVSVSASACSQKPPANELEEIWKDGIMRVGVSLNIPEENLYGGEKIAAFYTGIFEEVAKRMGVRVEFVELPKKGFVSAVANREVDAAAVAFDIAQHPDEMVDFADSYFLVDPLPGETAKSQDKEQAGSIPVYVLLADGAKELQHKLNEVLEGMVEEGFIDRLAKKHNLTVRIETLK